MPDSERNPDIAANAITLIIFGSSDNVTRLVLLLLGKMPGKTDVHICHTLSEVGNCMARQPVDLVLIAQGDQTQDGPLAVRALRRRYACLPLFFMALEERTMRSALTSGANECCLLPSLQHDGAPARLQRMLVRLAGCFASEDYLPLLRASLRDIGEALHISNACILASCHRLTHFHDTATGAHQKRVARYAVVIAALAGLDPERMSLLEKTAHLHDIGKIGIAASILNKRGRLDEDEMTLMRMHAQIGQEILSNCASPLLRSAACIAGSHHERFDGDGYPHGLRGEKIPLEARIVALADVYDALSSSRPYKPGWGQDLVNGFIRQNSGTHFDPDLVAVMMRHDEALVTARQRMLSENC